MFGHHPVMFGMNMWKRTEQVQQQRMQQLEAGASALAQQVEVRIFFFITRSCIPTLVYKVR